MLVLLMPGRVRVLPQGMDALVHPLSPCQKPGLEIRDRLLKGVRIAPLRLQMVFAGHIHRPPLVVPFHGGPQIIQGIPDIAHHICVAEVSAPQFPIPPDYLLHKVLIHKQLEEPVPLLYGKTLRGGLPLPVVVAGVVEIPHAEAERLAQFLV